MSLLLLLFRRSAAAPVTAITKPPLDMPASGSALQAFEPQRVDYGSPEASGRIGGVQAGFPLWLGVWTLGTIGPRKSDEWRAFMLRLRGATRRFLGRDMGRPYPLAHITGFARMTVLGGAPFTGAASGWSEALTGDGDSELTLDGLPPGLILSVGDYVGFKWTATEASVAGLLWQAAVRVVEGGMADSSGSITVVSEPPLSPAIPGSALAHLDKPAVVMAQVTDQSKLEAIDRRLAVRGGTLTGIQDIRA